MGIVLRREVNNTDEAHTTLSYINDSVMFDDPNMVHVPDLSIKTSYTFAIGDSSSKKYPRAMFLNGKQVYPPIANVQLFNLHGSSTSNGEFSFQTSDFGYYCMHHNMPYAYLFSKSIKALYSNEFMHDDRTNSSIGIINEVEIPSFNPATSPDWSSKYAYYMGDYVHIKDGDAIPYKFPEFDENGTYTYIGTIWPHDVLSELSFEQGDTAHDLEHIYDTSGIPLAYNASAHR